MKNEPGKGSYWALGSHNRASRNITFHQKTRSHLDLPKAIVRSNVFLSDVETENAVKVITDIAPITEEVHTTSPFTAECKQEDFSRNHLHTSNGDFRTGDLNDSFSNLYKSSLDSCSVTGNDWMLPIDWLKESIRLTNASVDEFDIDYYCIVDLLEEIKTDKLNPDNIADLAASLNRFLSQTNDYRNGQLTTLSSDLGSELQLMPNATENSMLIGSFDQHYSTGHFDPPAVSYVDSSTQYSSLLNGYHHMEEVYCDSQIPVSIGDIYPQQTIAVGSLRPRQCTEATEDTDEDDFNWDKLL